MAAPTGAQAGDLFEEPGVFLDDTEMNGVPDSPSMELGEIRQDVPTSLNASTSAYGADDERSDIPRPSQPPQEPRDRPQRQQPDTTCYQSHGRYRCRCNCGCEACFCDEPWPAEDPDRTPRAVEPMVLQADFTSSAEITAENFTDRIYGLGLDDFMDVMDIENNPWGTARRRYRLSGGYGRYPQMRWDMSSPDLPEYHPQWRYRGRYSPTFQYNPDSDGTQYLPPMFHMHDRRRRYRDNRRRYRNQTSHPNNASLMSRLARPISYSLDLLHLFATLVILYGAVQLYLFDLRLNTTIAFP
ncbi:hypothetical protein DTO164E3_6355 [Paecilomyces variotii]|nr:hypothetical protein DTO164E3_6355 [Paecilomyces variotii]KAJ9288837.1 hypothetical protein DTO021C3_3637 [Paecilomyces variotii]KAJ9407873.1 hypothetical protein DTO045G8_4340 [Paecilomyces variotii]